MKNSSLIVLAILGLVLFLMPSVAPNSTRLLRLNNPGGIRRTSDQWQGASSEQPDHEFVSFIAPEYGIRAMARILNNYAERGLDTVEKIISTWAPPAENLTGDYVEHVADLLRVPEDEPIDVRRSLPQLISAIITHENGSQPYTASVIARGIALAG